MMKMKKMFLGITTGAMVLTPTIAVISCSDSDNSNGTIDFTDKKIFAGREKVDAPLGVVNKVKGWKSVLALDGPSTVVKDKSFNESAYEGMSDGEIVKILGLYRGQDTDPNSPKNSVKPASKKDSDFVSMYEAVNVKTLIVANGFLHVAPLSSEDGQTSIINKAVILTDGDVKAKNIASIIYKSNQSGFLVGYMSGIYLNEKYENFKEDGLKVGTFGGMNIPGVTPFMMGFQNGVKYFNANKGNYKHEIHFIDNGSKVDYFSGNFNTGGGDQIAENLIGEGADLIFPVAGPQTNDVVKKLKAVKNTKTKIIGVDVAQELDPTFKDYVVFSALKKIKNSIMKMIEIISGTKTNDEVGYNSFEGFGGLTIGDLDNDLVGASKGLQGDPKAKVAWEAAQDPEIKKAAKSSELNPLKFDF